LAELTRLAVFLQSKFSIWGPRSLTISALIIDDEQLARDELKYLLDQVGGVEVVAQGTNGIEAVDLIEEHHPDLVFLDVQMPGLDGFAVIQRLMDREAVNVRVWASIRMPSRCRRLFLPRHMTSTPCAPSM
jgi:CheY-like chemotaxis protein